VSSLKVLGAQTALTKNEDLTGVFRGSVRSGMFAVWKQRLNMQKYNFAHCYRSLGKINLSHEGKNMGC